MSDYYIVRYMSGYVEEVEPIDDKPDDFTGIWHVWLLEYKHASTTPVRVSKQKINMQTVEKVQEAIKT